jgi:dihydroorotase
VPELHPAPGTTTVVRGGTVVDPLTGTSALMDVRVEGRRVGAIGRDLPVPLGAQQLDATGCLVSAGWIDLHVHVFGEIGIADPDAIGVLAGVTTMADAGGAGPITMEDFAAQTRAARTRVYSIVYMETAGAAQIGGIPTHPRELEGVRLGDLVRAVEAHPELIRAVKTDALSDLTLAWPRLTLMAAQLVERPAFFHVGNFPVNRTADVAYVAALMDMLRPGDIVTHLYTGEGGGLVDANGTILAEARAAQARGVIFDVGYAFSGFSIEVARMAMDAGFVPDTISSDLQVRNARRRVGSLASVASRFLMLGMPLLDVIGRITVAPAEALGIDAGRLEVGGAADITIFEVVPGSVVWVDGRGVEFGGDQRLEVRWTMKDGDLVTADPTAVTLPDNLRFHATLSADDAWDDVDPCTSAFLQRLAAVVEAVPCDGEVIQLCLRRLIEETSTPWRPALAAVYRAVSTRRNGQQAGWLLADLGRSHGRAAVADRLRLLARTLELRPARAQHLVGR